MRLDIPLMRQQGARACLPACARMVLAFYGIKVGEGELSRLMRKTRAGTSVLNVDLLEEAGLGVRVESGVFEVEQIKQMLDEGFPVIAAVMTEALPYWTANRPHAVVLVGYDERFVYLNDPKFPDAPKSVSWDDFLAAWEEFGCFGAVIAPARSKPLR